MRFRFIDSAGAEHRVATVRDLVECIRHGRVHDETLVFDSELARWVRADTIDVFVATKAALSGPSVRVPATPSTSDGGARLGSAGSDSEASRQYQERAPDTESSPGDTEPSSGYPWRRLVARWVDYVLLFIGGGIVLGLLAPAALENLIGAQVLAFAIWIPIEATLLTRFGATVGRHLVGLRVLRHDGARLDFPAALNRSAKVWAQGMGAGLPIVYLLTQFRAYQLVRRDKIAPWDRSGDHSVISDGLRPTGTVLALLIVIGFIVLVAYGYSQG